MRWKTILVIALVLILISGCVKIGRYSIQLISPKNGKNDVSLRPTFLWSFKSAFPVNVTYDFYLSSGGEFGDPIAKDLKDMSFVPDKSLEPGREYRWKVVAKTPAGYVNSEVWNFKTVENRPPNKPSLSSPPNGSTVGIDVTFSWSCSDPDGDRITFKLILSNHTDLSSPVVVDGINSPSVKLTLSPNSTYYWKVVAYDERGLSSESEVWKFKTKGFPPVKPKLLYPKPGEKSVPLLPTLSWFSYDPDGSSVVYDVLFGNSETSLSTILENSTRSSYRLSRKLSMNTTYYWKVVARDSEGNTSESDLGYFTTLYVKNDPPTTPTILSPKSGTTGLSFVGVTLSWSPSTDPEGKEVTYDVYLGNDKTAVEDRSLETLIAEDLKDTQYTISKGTLKPGTTYYWLVVAKDGFNETPSELASFTTMGALTSFRYVYSVAKREGMYILDFSDILSPKIKKRIFENYNTHHYQGVAASRGYLYVNRDGDISVYRIMENGDLDFVRSVGVGEWGKLLVFGDKLVLFSCRTVVFDISDPSYPKKLYDTNLICGGNNERDVAYNDGKLYLISSNWDPGYENYYELKILDINSGMVLKDDVLYNLPNWYSGVEAMGNYLYLLRRESKWSGTVYLVVYDASDLNSMKEISEIPIRDDWIYFIYKSDDGKYILPVMKDFTGKIFVMDASDPSNPYLVRTIEFDNGWINDLKVTPEGYMLASCEGGGVILASVDMEQIISRVNVHSFWYFSMQSVGNYIYVANSDDHRNLTIYDSNLNEVANIKEIFEDWVRDMEVIGNYLYASIYRGLMIFDVSDPLTPNFVKTIPGGEFRRIVISSDKLYALTENSIYVYKDPSDPAKVAFESSIPLPRDGQEYLGVTHDGKVAVVGSGDYDKRGIYIVDLLNRKVSYQNGNYIIRWIRTVDKYAIVGAYDTDWKFRLLYIDVSNPESPKISEYPTDDVYSAVIYDDKYLVGWGRGLEIFDISTPMRFKPLDSYFEDFYPYEPVKFALMDDYLYSIISWHEFVKFDLSDLNNPEIIKNLGLFYSQQLAVVGE